MRRSKATVVVPVRNEVRAIDATLGRLVAQTYAPIEILVVDGQSDDGTIEAVSSWAERDERIRLVPNPGRTAACGLNVGAANAAGDWLVRVDGHSVVSDDYVERLVEHLATGRWGGVGGRKDGVGSGPGGAAIAAVLGSPFGVGGSKYHYATETMEVDHVPFGAYPLEVIREVGGWDERLVANEDFEFDARVRKAGHRLLLDPSVVTAWRCRDRIIDLARQYLRYGRGKADVALLHPTTLRLRHLAPPALVMALIGVLVAGVWSLIPLVVLLAAYGVAVVVASIAIARDMPAWAGRIRVPGALVAMHLAWGWGFWLGVGRLIRGRFRVSEPGASGKTRWDSPEWKIPTDD